MNSAFRFSCIAAIYAALYGCQADLGVRASPDSEYTYNPDQLATFAIANQAPAVFPASMNSTERVRRLFAYPRVSVTPMGQFLATHAMSSSPIVVDKYLNGGEVTYGQKMPGVDDMLVLGVGLGGAGGAALVGAALASSGTPGADIRERSSSALCFIDAGKTPAAGDALIQCQDLVVGHMVKSLNAKLTPGDDTMRIITGSIPVSGVQLKEVIYVIKINAGYATGFAPKDLGGYKAHILNI